MGEILIALMYDNILNNHEFVCIMIHMNHNSPFDVCSRGGDTTFMRSEEFQLALLPYAIILNAMASRIIFKIYNCVKRAVWTGQAMGWEGMVGVDYF